MPSAPNQRPATTLQHRDNESYRNAKPSTVTIDIYGHPILKMGSGLGKVLSNGHLTMEMGSGLRLDLSSGTIKPTFGY